MFPYIEHPKILIGPISVTAFTLLMWAAVGVGFVVTLRRSVRIGLGRADASSLTAATIFCGLLGSHLFEVIAYHPKALVQDPLLLIRLQDGMSSFGGILGGLLAAFLIMKRRRMNSLDMAGFADALAYAFPFAWMFGRAGCALAHDHLGVLSNHWLSVRFPGGPRFDLGLLEFLYTLLIAVVFACLGRRERPAGFFLGLFFVAYGPVRFVLDSFRIGDARYLGLTPGQYFSVATTLAGVSILWFVIRRNGRKPECKKERPMIG